MNTADTRNVPLLQATMQHIIDHPEQHDQSVFACGTAACFAGRAAILSGWSVRDVNRAWHMWKAGGLLLGITYEETTTLFAPDNTSTMLELMVQDLINGDQLRLQPHYRRLAQTRTRPKVLAHV